MPGEENAQADIMSMISITKKLDHNMTVTQENLSALTTKNEVAKTINTFYDI